MVNAGCYILRRLRALPWLRNLQLLLNLRLPFFLLVLLSALRNPALPPEEINRGIVIGKCGVKLTMTSKNGVEDGIGLPDSGVTKAFLKN